MTYGKKVMVIGGVRVTDAPDVSRNGCGGCFFMRGHCTLGDAKVEKESDMFDGDCIERLAIYIPAPDTLRDAYEQTDATARLTDVEEL